MPRIRLLAPLVAGWLLAASYPASAAEGRGPAVDPAARARLDEVAAAYKALASYADEGTFTIELTIDGRARAHSWPMHLSFQRPNRLALDAGDARLVCDGKTLAVTVVPTKKYQIRPAPAKVEPATVTEGPLGAMLLGGPGGMPAFLVLQLALADDPGAAILAGGTQLRLEADGVLAIDAASGPGWRLHIDPTTKLVRRIELAATPADLAAVAPAGHVLGAPQVGWSSGPIRTEAPDAKLFAFEPPPGFSEVAALEAAAPAGAKAPEHPLVGKPAPEFSLTALDGAGKTRRLTKDDLAGKVVLLDFWATWCPPCLRELPEIARLVEAYAGAGKEVVIAAVSQDREPREGTVRALIEETLRKKDLALQRPPVGLVALDPEMALGAAFQVEALPTVVLLDAKGVVQAVRVGYREDVREVLARDLDALLAGQDLRERGAKPAGEAMRAQDAHR